MLAQTTDSGSNNNPMASEMRVLFKNAEDPVVWSASSHHVRCYAHKLNLTVGHGLKVIGQKVSVAKPCIPHGHALPIPALQANDGDDEVVVDNSESDEETDNDLPDQPDGVDEDETNQELEVTGEVCEKDDVVALALVKVSTQMIYLSLFFDSNINITNYAAY